MSKSLIGININLGESNAAYGLQKLISTFSPRLAWLNPDCIELEKGRIRLELKKEEIIEVKKAEIEAEYISHLGWSISKQLVLESENRIRNFLKIIEYFAEEVEAYKIDDNELDANWVGRFINISQDCNNDELRKLWARILAGEISKSGSFSIRTIEFINTLEQDEAQIIEKIGGFIFETDGLLNIPKLNADIYRKFDISESEFSILSVLGLIKEKTETFVFHESRYGDAFLKVRNNQMKYSISAYTFTKVGRQVFALTGNQRNMAFLEFFANHIANNNLGMIEVITTINGVSKDHVKTQ